MKVHAITPRDREHWKALRSTHVGASEVAALLRTKDGKSAHKYKTRAELVEEKRTGKSAPMNPAMWRGLVGEASARDMLWRLTSGYSPDYEIVPVWLNGKRTEPPLTLFKRVWKCRDYLSAPAWGLGATPDDKAKLADGRTAVVNFKTGGRWAFRKVYLKSEPPLYCAAQVSLEAMLMELHDGAESGSYAAFTASMEWDNDGKTPIGMSIHEVTRIPELEEIMTRAGPDFWREVNPSWEPARVEVSAEASGEPSLADLVAANTDAGVSQVLSEPADSIEHIGDGAPTMVIHNESDDRLPWTLIEPLFNEVKPALKRALDKSRLGFWGWLKLHSGVVTNPDDDVHMGPTSHVRAAEKYLMAFKEAS